MVNDNLFALKIEFGQNYLFFDVLRLSAGFSLGTTFGGYNTMFFGNDAEEILFQTWENLPIEDYIKGRLLSHYWLGFTVGIGVIPF
jgi:hypothetical protein